MLPQPSSGTNLPNLPCLHLNLRPLGFWSNWSVYQSWLCMETLARDNSTPYYRHVFSLLFLMQDISPHLSDHFWLRILQWIYQLRIVLPFTPLWVNVSPLKAELEWSWVLLAKWLQVNLSIPELMPIHFYSKWCTARWQVNSTIQLWFPETGLLAHKKFSLTSNLLNSHLWHHEPNPTWS